VLLADGEGVGEGTVGGGGASFGGLGGCRHEDYGA